MICSILLIFKSTEFSYLFLPVVDFFSANKYFVEMEQSFLFDYEL